MRVGGRRRRGGPARVMVVGSGRAFVSGISVYTCRLANALAGEYPTSVILMRRLLPRRLYPGAARVGQDLIDLRYDGAVEVFDGVDWFWGPGAGRALRFLWARRPDVVIFEWWTGSVLHSYLLLAVAARLSGARVAVEFHEVLDTAEVAHRWFSRYVAALSRPFLSLASEFVVHSEFDRRAVADHYHLPDAAVTVVPHGPYDHLAPAGPPTSAGLPTSAGSPDPLFELLFFGTIRPYKGLEHLVAAFDGLTPEDAARFHLTVVGETWEGWDEPLRAIERSPRRAQITVVNRYVTDAEAAGFFAAADAVVLPYLRSSSSGPLHIAMSRGLPVAVTGVGGLREAAGGYEGVRFIVPGDVADLRDAILELPALAGRTYPDPHSWTTSVALLRPVILGRDTIDLDALSVGEVPPSPGVTGDAPLHQRRR